MKAGFSILTPSFNQAAFLPRCLASVAAQSHVAVQHIVMDNASTDGSRALLQGHAADNFYFESEPDSGQTHALHKALQLATMDFVGWLNADEYYENGALAFVAEIFDRHPEAQVVYGDFRRVTASGAEIRVNRQWKYRADVGAIVTPIIQSCSAFFRRERMLQVGAFESPWKYVMDWDLFTRVVRYDFEAVHVKRILANYAMHNDAKTSADYAGFLAEVKQLRSAILLGLPEHETERLRRRLYRRMVLDMAMEGVLLDKVLFKIWGQRAWESEFGVAGTRLPLVEPLLDRLAKRRYGGVAT